MPNPAVAPVVPAPQPLSQSATIAAHPLMKQILTKNAQLSSSGSVNGVNGVSKSNSSSRCASPAAQPNVEHNEEDQRKVMNAKDFSDFKSNANGQNSKEQNGTATSEEEGSDDEKPTSRKSCTRRNSESVLQSLVNELRKDLGKSELMKFSKFLGQRAG
ncbi:unnamed protein product [Strongylus vulgaris]|uniref:Uncharacterized protein n=1 Tax=Strongylus vulgaris TaxID=40348 RepID=A0A3P7J0G7_STRVU|nr:unnamed protein product [Strongylus vulgaris]